MSAAEKLVEALRSDSRTSKKVNSTYLQLVEIFPLQSISSKKIHEHALSIIEKLVIYSNAQSSKDKGVGLYLETLSKLVEDYESSQYVKAKVTGAEMLSYLMELKNLKQADLSNELGGQSIVSKVLSGERKLNVRQIKSLANRFKVSPSVFL